METSVPRENALLTVLFGTYFLFGPTPLMSMAKMNILACMYTPFEYLDRTIKLYLLFLSFLKIFW